MNDLQKELAEELAKREKIHQQQIAMYSDGTHSRAKVTTLNARLGRVQDRIVWIRQEMKKETLVLVKA